MRRIRLPEVNLVILRRPAPEFPESISEFLALPSAEAQFALEKGADPDLAPALLDEILDLQSPDCLDFYEDINEMAKHFFDLTRASSVGLRLEKVDDDQCRFFHVDRVSYRLLSTYWGAGTQWLRDEDVIRDGLGKGENSGIQKPGSALQALETGWVGVLKGERENRGRGLVHRSPPVSEASMSRILLRLDVLE